MDGPSDEKDASLLLEALDLEGTSDMKQYLKMLRAEATADVKEFKRMLRDTIRLGKDPHELSGCLAAMMTCTDPELLSLAVQAISELAKSEDTRERFAIKEVIEPILEMLEVDVTTDRLELVKHCCRVLGNLCCDCDRSRQLLLDHEGVKTLRKLLKTTLETQSKLLNEIKVFTCKVLLNYAIGGQQFTESLVEVGMPDTLQQILSAELVSEDMNDDLVSTVLLVLSLVNDNPPDFLFAPEVNVTVLNVLRETTNIEISQLCLEHLHAQAEHDSVKTLLAEQGGVQLVCSRLEQLVERQAARELQADDEEVEALVKQACDLVIIVLTGDQAMHLLYELGQGAVYKTMVRWLYARNPHQLVAALLAIGNFARQDDYCAKMMDSQIFDQLLDIFEYYHLLGLELREGNFSNSMDLATATKLQQASLSAIRNLTVPVANKKVAAAKGRAAPVLLGALPHVEDHHVAYKLLAAIRMLVDGQESVAGLLAGQSKALEAVARWGAAPEHAGAAAEAPRLLAWSVKQLAGRPPHFRNYVEVDGCISSLVNMLLASHSVMQNEAILALTLLAIHSLKDKPDQDFDYEKNFIAHLLKSEIGKHVTVLLDTNCAKMPIEVVENLLAFLDVTCKVNQLALDYKNANVQESLEKLVEARSDLTDDLKSCVKKLVALISDKKE